MNGISDTIAALASDAGNNSGVMLQGAADLTLNAEVGDHSFAGAISGGGAFTKNGAATQRLSGDNTLGTVDVNAGSLLMFGNNTTGTVNVDGGTFGGAGSVSGGVVINNSAHLSPGASGGTLDVGSLTVNTGSVLDFELGSPFLSDRVNVTGQLTLNGGSVNVSNLDGQLDYTTYTLIDYDTLIGSVDSLSVLDGPDGFAFDFVDTGSAINLVVSVPGLSGDFNDDGVVDSSDYLVWKKYESTEADLPNDEDLPGPIGAAHYALWQQHFGEVAGGGSGGQVPEPTAIAMIALGLAAFSSRRRQRG
jgi:autotransporter-associated beta strand protein